MHASPALPAATAASIRLIAWRLLKALLIVLAISTLFAGLFARDFWRSMVYTVPISCGCWLFIDGGRRVVGRWVHRKDAVPPGGHRSDWPGWPLMVVVLVVGTFLGYTLGNAVGNLVTGQASPGLIGVDARQALTILALSLIPGSLATYAFWARARVAASEARAQRAQREAAETQLRLLQSQLEPHMLFNTLANLRVLVTLDPPRAQAMLDHLIAFLRATLGASRAERHALSAEFARSADYLALMRIRMGERLRVELSLPDALAALPVPPLLLQPLVENAIRHGLEPQVEGGRLSVRARREGDSLVLEVEDDGVGLSPALPGAERREDGSAGGGFGTAQVRERLATLYGERAGMELLPAPQGGTLARITLPLHGGGDNAGGA